MLTKMKKIYLFSILCFISLLDVGAQVSNYVFSQFIGAYTALASATTVASGFQDDNAYGNLPIGFTFTYNNSTYTSVGVSTNGWMTFGAYFPNDNFAPISNSGGNGDCVSVLSGDMQLGPYQTCTYTAGSNIVSFTYTLASNFFNVGNVITGAGIPGGTTVLGISATNMTLSANATTSGTSITTPGSISYVTTGSSPNKIFTMQWRRLGRYSNDGTGKDDYINAQIKLYETTNVVDIVYGYCGTFNSNVMPSETGLVGSSSIDYNNRDVPLGFNWQSSSDGQASVATAIFSSSNNIPFGLVYRWTPPSPCSGTPATNTAIAGSTLACLGGNVNLNLSQSYTLTGLNYVWQAASNSSGPYTPINSSSISAHTATNINANTWFICVITCTNSSSSLTTSPIAITAVGSITNTIPYFEGFENVQVNNLLPNCSWAASSPTTICQTYTLQTTHNRLPKTGTKFAAFNFGTAAAGDYFYTNGLVLYAGVNYSAGASYITDGANGWSEFSLHFGSSQSTVGLSPIAFATGTLNNQIYSSLSGTFSVPTSGVYYIAVKAIGNTNPFYLSWDDLSVTAPCSLNTPSLSIAGGTQVPCANTAISLIASGATTYTWSSGPNTANTIVTPLANTSYTIYGSNIVGCIGMSVKSITVLPLPVVNASPSTQSICVTEVATITASGATSYTWNPSNSNASTFTLTPVNSNVYTVVCTGANNCVATATAQVIVDLCTGINESSVMDNQLMVYPNPTTDMLHIVFEEEGLKALEIMDMTGKIVKAENFNTREVKINLKDLSRGVYFLKFNINNSTLIKKIIKN